MNKIALIPAYESGRVLVKIVKELYHHQYTVVVVDDGSGFRYRSLFSELKEYAAVISYDQNQGKGYALKKGLQAIASRNLEGVIVTMDCDGQHLVSDADKICLEVEIEDSALVIGSRKWDQNTPVKSRFGNSLTRKVFRMFTGVKVFDTQSGLRAFRTDRIPFMLSIPGKRYEYEMNVLLMLTQNGLKITEIPIETIYFDQRNSISHFHSILDSFRIYNEIFRFAGSSLVSFLVDYGFFSLLALCLGTTGSALIAANCGARLISSILNFYLNRSIVFRSHGNFWAESLKYFGLVLFNLIINSMLLTGLTGNGASAYLIKLLVELLMFIISYTIQHFLIFTKPKSFV